MKITRSIVLCACFCFGVHAGEWHTVKDFGSNPGALIMKVYSPSERKENVPLMVILHGCSQDAEGYAEGTGWTKYADQYGLILLTPQQNKINSMLDCFNWFRPADTSRDQGEALSIINMVKRVVKNNSINKRRIFVSGLSAGAAMANALLAGYPEVFAGGALVAGSAYACANNLREAYMCMAGVRRKGPRELGDAVRAASDYRGPWPMISIWQGSRDYTVNPANAEELVKQWSNLHQAEAEFHEHHSLPAGHDRFTYKDPHGRIYMERFLVNGMGHAQAVNPGNTEDSCGTPARYIMDAGICTAYHISKFFRLTR